MRRNNRCRNWDYASPGYYFVTIDVQDKLIDYWWNEIKNHFNRIELDEYVIMPDHVHGIVKIDNNGQTPTTAGRHRSARTTYIHGLGDIIQWFKTMTASAYIRGVKENNWPKFHRRLWQRNYYDQIIRDGEDLERVRRYILDNPRKINLTVGI